MGFALEFEKYVVAFVTMDNLIAVSSLFPLASDLLIDFSPDPLGTYTRDAARFGCRCIQRLLWVS